MGAVVITGASSGIGLALCKYYLAQGHKVYAICRQISPELAATGAIVVANIDLTTTAGIASLQQALADQNIAILINNAGVFGNNILGDIDYSDVERQWMINAVAPLRVTEALLPCLTAGAKIALITSRMGSIEDNSSGGYYGYRMSKAALNAAGVSLARDLLARHIAVAVLHPGFVQTRMVGFAGDVTPVTAAEGLAQRIAELNLENTGTFWHANGEILPW